MASAGDTFVEATTDTTLTSHTPTGTNAGTGWGVLAGSAQVLQAVDLAEDTNTGVGNRLNMNNDLGSSEMDVTADISFTGSPVAGNFIGTGVTGRASSSTTQPVYEGYYNFGSGGGEWVLDTTAASDSLVEAYPGGTVALKLEIRTGAKKLYANGVLKATLTDNNGPTNQYAGILGLNFQGDAAKRCRWDNFMATSNTSVALTGSSSSSGVGTLGVTHDQAVTGVSNTVSPGSLTLSLSMPLIGEMSPLVVGSLGSSRTIPLIGVAVVVSVGTVVPSGGDTGDVTVALTGVTTTLAPGSLTLSLSIPLTGAIGTLGIGSLLAVPTIALTGVSSTSSLGSLTPSLAIALTGVSSVTGIGAVVASGGVSQGALRNRAFGLGVGYRNQ